MVSEKMIDQWIADHKDEMIEELKLWVSKPSVSRADLYKDGAPYGPDCRKMLDLALERGRHYGFETEDYEGYCGAIHYGNADDEIGFVVHLDVVPEGDHWIYEPYQPVIKDGYMIARGCGDNKGSGVLCLFLMRFFKENGIELKHGLRILAGCAEETGMADFDHYVNVMKGSVPGVSLVADAMFPVCYAQKGGYDGAYKIPCGKNIVSFDAGLVRNAVPDTASVVVSGITLDKVNEVLADFPKVSAEESEGGVLLVGHGKAGHAAFQVHGEKNNAIVIVSEALEKLEKETGLDLAGASFIAKAFETAFGDGMGLQAADEESGELTINAGVIHKDGDDLLLEIDIRYPISDNGDRITACLEKAVKKCGGELIIRKIAKPYYIAKDDPKVVALMDAYKDVTGEEVKPYAIGGGTYSRVVPNAITFGPGLMNGHRAEFLPEGHGGAHGPDETLNIKDWLTGFKIYILSVLKLDQV